MGSKAKKATKQAKAAPRSDAAEKLRKQALAEIGERLKVGADGGHAKAAEAEASTPADSQQPARKRHVGPGGKRVAAPKGAKIAKSKRMSALDAAAMVLATNTEPMTAKDLIEQMEKRGLWTSPGGKTPASTLYAAIIREIAKKGRAARFVKADRGLFAPGKGV